MQGRHRVCVSHCDSCDGIQARDWPCRRINEVTAEPRLECIDRQEILGPALKIVEPIFRHARPGDLPFEALVVNLKQAEAILEIAKIEPKRVAVFEQDMI